MKFLLYGIKGWIGAKVFKLLQDENIDVVAGNCRVDNIQELENEIQTVCPTHVISLIGRTHGTYKEKVYGTIDYLVQPGKLVENVKNTIFISVI